MDLTDSEVAEDLHDEAWYQFEGKWYCPQHAPSPATQHWMELVTDRLNAGFARLEKRLGDLEHRTSGQVHYGPIKQETVWVRKPLPDADAELLQRVEQSFREAVHEELAAIRGRLLSSMSSDLPPTFPRSPSPGHRPPSGAASTPGDTPSG